MPRRGWLFAALKGVVRDEFGGILAAGLSTVCAQEPPLTFWLSWPLCQSVSPSQQKQKPGDERHSGRAGGRTRRGRQREWTAASVVCSAVGVAVV